MSTIEERVGSALLQAMTHAADEWLDARESCPACGATRPLGGAPPEAAPPSPPAPPIPRPRAPAPGHAPLGPSGPGTHRAGPLEFVRGAERRVSRIGAPHYRTWDLDVRCLACGLARSIHRAEGAAYPAYSIRRTGTPAGPRLRWEIATRGGATAGAVIAGGGAPSRLDSSIPIDGATRWVCEQGRALIDRALDCDLAPLPEESQQAMRHEALRRVLPSIGAELRGCTPSTVG